MIAYSYLHCKKFYNPRKAAPHRKWRRLPFFIPHYPRCTMQFFINIIDLTKMDDMNFTYEPGGHFVYRSPSFAFKISQRLVGWKLQIWQRRWNGIYHVSMTFRTPVTAALYAFDFIRSQWTSWTTVRESLAKGAAYDQ